MCLFPNYCFVSMYFFSQACSTHQLLRIESIDLPECSVLRRKRQSNMEYCYYFWLLLSFNKRYFGRLSSIQKYFGSSRKQTQRRFISTWDISLCSFPNRCCSYFSLEFVLLWRKVVEDDEEEGWVTKLLTESQWINLDSFLIFRNILEMIIIWISYNINNRHDLLFL